VGRHRVRSRRATRRLVVVRVALAAVVLLGGGVAVAGWETDGQVPGGQTTGGSPTAVAGDRLPPPARLGVQLADGSSPLSAAPVPVQVRVPSIAVDSRLVPLGVDAAGALVPPEDTATAGWFAQGTLPGAVGPAVIAGHVDSYRGPGVFFRLSGVAPGDVVLVDRSDGSTVSFTVTRVDRYPKQAFPTDRVYAPTSGPELRLITCGGTFDRSVRSYEDNVVVSARLTG
jgi:sortase (surface protein transpeptidase)